MNANSKADSDSHWDELQNQSDLAWDLDAITDRQQAIDFLLRFENRLCVYSGYVEKLYSNYSFVVPEEEHGSITILPDEQAWHDTFNEIPPEAVEPTGIRDQLPEQGGRDYGQGFWAQQWLGLKRLAGRW